MINEAKLESIKQDVERDQAADEQAFAERNRVAKEQEDNSIAPRRYSRHQMILLTRKDNPDLKTDSALFRECLVLNAFNQEGANLRTLANFTGMSKGEVQRHLVSISQKIRAAQVEAVNKAMSDAVENQIREYPNESSDETASDTSAQDADRPDVDDRSETPVVDDPQADALPAGD